MDDGVNVVFMYGGRLVNDGVNVTIEVSIYGGRPVDDRVNVESLYTEGDR